MNLSEEQIQAIEEQYWRSDPDDRDDPEPDPPARLFQVLAPHAAELRVMPQQVRELPSLLHQVGSGESLDLLLESRRADEFAQHKPGIVETQGLIEIRRHEKVLDAPACHR